MASPPPGLRATFSHRFAIHKDRSALAMAYLKTQGFDVKYLEDGLLGLAELLRGDQARTFKP